VDWPRRRAAPSGGPISSVINRHRPVGSHERCNRRT
jgi:hypothetical protein